MISMDRFLERASQPRSRGQILVIVALAMLGLLITAGLATDVGILLMRKAQFDRAVDGAALAGAPEISTLNGLDTANDRGLEIIAANGIGLKNTAPGACPLAAADSYCGQKKRGNLPGSTDYHVEARWDVPLVFMQLAKIYSIPLVSSAEASYYDNVDMFVSDNDQGLLRSANLELFGKYSCSSNGDAFTPINHFGSDGNNDNYLAYDPNDPGKYTYRIAIPQSYADKYDLVRVELYDPQSGNLGRGPNPSPYATNMNLVGSPERPTGDATTYYPTTVENVAGGLEDVTAGAPVRTCAAGSTTAGYRAGPCLHGGDVVLGKDIDPNNPFWYVRMDEIRGACYTSGYTLSWMTTTEFTLYYYKQLASGLLQRVNLAKYTGLTDDGSAASLATALKWVSPGAPAAERMPAYDCKTVSGIATANCGGATPLVGSPPEPATTVSTCPPNSLGDPCPGNKDFIVNLNPDDDVNGQPANEVPNIYQDPTTKVRYLYLDVKGIDGYSENNWSLWAGPALSEDPSVSAPSFINARQIYIYQKSASGNTVHSSRGIATYGVGRLPMNSDSESPTMLPLGTIGPELSGAKMTIRLWDADAGATPPVIFYYDTIPQADWSQCWGTTGPTGECFAQGSKQGWQQKGNVPDTFGNQCYTNYPPTGNSCGQWTYFEFYNPTDATATPKEGQNPVPFYGGRLMVRYEAGGQDSFGWWITVQARPTLVN